MNQRKVLIKTREVGQRFGCCAVICDARTGRELAETGVRPYGNRAAAYADGESLAEKRGWLVVEHTGAVR